MDSQFKQSNVPVVEPVNFPRSALRNIALVVILFSVPLYQLVRFALQSELYSYVLLMPVVSIYLIRQRKNNWREEGSPAYKLGAALLIAGAAVFAVYELISRRGSPLAVEDELAFSTLSFLLCLVGTCCVSLGRNTLRALSFPLAMLFFMIPIPIFVMDMIEIFLQYGSAYVTHAMLTLAGTPFAREGLVFHLPNISIRVAPECSGIHSTWILIITSLLAGYLFLRSPYKRAILTLAVIPLALLRNGFRVFTISELCVHIGPQMIDHWIHHKGGPIFFILSLIPFFILLVVLQKTDRLKPKAP